MHNADKTVSLKIYPSSGNVEVKEYHGTLLLFNGNLTKEELYDNSPAGEEILSIALVLIMTIKEIHYLILQGSKNY
jgi:hypothetical protein